jgi:hypothetical protein
VAVMFPDQPSLSITLTSFAPGTGTACSAGMIVGQSCSPLAGASPIVLTDEAFGTTAQLSVSGTATDGTGTSDVTGIFSADIIGIAPLALSEDTTFTTTNSGVFSVTAIETPEPRAISLFGAAVLFLGIVVSKRRKSVA